MTGVIRAVDAALAFLTRRQVAIRSADGALSDPRKAELGTQSLPRMSTELRSRGRPLSVGRQLRRQGKQILPLVSLGLPVADLAGLGGLRDRELGHRRQPVSQARTTTRPQPLRASC